jgi:outer membrane protein assembly factor BamB/ankyrin repeat protein
MHRLRWILLIGISVSVGLGTPASLAAAETTKEALWAAARTGDVKALEELLAKGADVNAKNEIGISALWLATSKGHLEAVKLLLKHKADVNVRDGIWYQTPLSQATSRGQLELARLLLDAGAEDADTLLLGAAARGQLEMAKLLLEKRKVSQDALDAALLLVNKDRTELRELLTKAGAKPIPPAPEAEQATWKPYLGVYQSDNGGKLTVEVMDGLLVARGGQGGTMVLKPAGKDTFKPMGRDQTLSFTLTGAQASRLSVKLYTAENILRRLDEKDKEKEQPRQKAVAEATGAVATPLNWPQFRGPAAAGVADGQNPPTTWDAAEGINVRWKTPIPGLGHSCPVVWGDRIFVTTAISGDPNPKVRTGNYGDVTSVNDVTPHTWKVCCLDKNTGKILWERTMLEGVVPKFKRHLKGSQANCTPATDGRRVVVCLGSEGLYCYDFDSKLLWKRDLGVLDTSFIVFPEHEWGFGSSPIIHDGLVILQCDLSKDSFIAAYSILDGSQVWSTPRDEIPSWSTPTIWQTPGRIELVTNAAQYARGYDPATGKELWRLAKKSEVTIPTPFAARGLLYVTSGNRPIQPIFAIRPDAAGDISLKEGEDKSRHIAWSKLRGGPYMPTPIVYGDYLYTCSNAGVVTCYDADTGKEIYKERLGGARAYTASILAADGKLYFTAEEGEVRVVKAGPTFELLAVNVMADVCMATPAISDGMIFVRTQHFMYGIGRKETAAGSGGN